MEDRSEALEDVLANITVVSLLLNKKLPNVTGEFHVLGGAAMVLHECSFRATVDIDTANVLTKEVKDCVEEFLSDEAASVAVLPENYVDRLVAYDTHDCSNVCIKLLSIEDLVITKLWSGRSKDYSDVKACLRADKVNINKLLQIIAKELPVDKGNLVRDRFLSLDY